MDAADDHYRRYTPQDLAGRLGCAGLVVEHQRWVNLLGVAAWWLNGKILRRTFVDEGSYALFDRIVPVVRGVERLWPPPVGLSIITVARKPAGAG
jgi:hypothetical protein